MEILIGSSIEISFKVNGNSNRLHKKFVKITQIPHLNSRDFPLEFNKFCNGIPLSLCNFTDFALEFYRFSIEIPQISFWNSTAVLLEFHKKFTGISCIHETPMKVL